jgi:hypothetical protein
MDTVQRCRLFSALKFRITAHAVFFVRSLHVAQNCDLLFRKYLKLNYKRAMVARFRAVGKSD